ncbi:hypothetical protein [Corallococcus silvisoli]|uniref:hypothetical protein n=1 Tax=Corallococcus silvisoli TaxID=2697031 RepID=UPI001377688D|nr:hypothetical protein [Corallococcus silvisoli]NBD11350.1 hypothetical protein [Corallococcus silvisoli]
MRLLPRLVALAFLFGTPALAGPVPPGCEEDAAACKEDCTIEYGGNGSVIRKLTRCFDDCSNKRTQCARQFNAVNNRAPDAPEAAAERRPGKTEAAKLREIEEKDRRREDDPFGDEENKPVRGRPVRDAYDDPPPEQLERKGYRASDAETERKSAKGNPRQTAAVPARATEPAPARTPPPPSPAVAPEPERSESPDIEAFAEPPPRATPPPRAEPPAPKPAPKPVVAEPAQPSRPSATEDEDLPPPPPPVAKKEPARPAPPPRPTPPPEPKKDISDWDPNGD